MVFIMISFLLAWNIFIFLNKMSNPGDKLTGFFEWKASKYKVKFSSYIKCLFPTTGV